MGTPASGTVLKAFAVLRLFHQHTVLGVSQCAELLDLPRPTAHRMLHSLAVAGAVERAPSGGYRLALGMFEIGSKTSYYKRFREVAQKPLGFLASELKLSSHLAVRVETNIVYLLEASAAAYGPRSLGVIGDRNPLHSTALGKLLLAHAPQSIIDDTMAQELQRFTRYTVTQPERLHRQLEEIRDTGFAHVCEERVMGVSALAAPIRDQSGHVVAGVGVTYPAEKHRGQLGRLQSPLLRTARAIEQNLATRPRIASVWDDRDSA